LDGLVEQVIEKKPSSSRTLIYKYDQVQRLVKVEDSSLGAYGYEYDQLGGRTKWTGPRDVAGSAAYDWAGRMTQLHGNACLHDGSGNLVSYALGGTKSLFDYSANNQLVLVRRNNRQTRYRYDGEGKLVARASSVESGGELTRFVCNPHSSSFEPLAMLDSQGRMVLYLWGWGAPLATISYGKTEFLFVDGLCL